MAINSSPWKFSAKEVFFFFCTRDDEKYRKQFNMLMLLLNGKINASATKLVAWNCASLITYC